MKYEIIFGIEGWGSTYIEAESEDEAVEMFFEGDWTSAKENVGYEFEDIELS